MTDKYFKEGTIIKGRDLKGHILCKILSEDLVMRRFQYRMGMNEDVNMLAMFGSCKAGLHFCFIGDICEYLGYGTKLAVVSIPDDEDVYVDDGKFRTHRLRIKRIMPLKKISTWKYLLENGADIIQARNVIRHVAEYGYLNVVKYLHKQGADITENSNFIVNHAALEGYLPIVKYMYENGVDITAEDNHPVRYAAEYGHLEVVKYLYENGADITAKNNYALKWAAVRGHLEVVKYLCENGADINVCYNFVVETALRRGYLDIVKYLNSVKNKR